MEPLDDGIHKCKECDIYKEDGVTCSSLPELKVPVCEYCDTKSCCRAPALVLMRCEQNTILDRIEEGEYVESEYIVPFNFETKYCKHMDIKTMNCKVYSQRPIGCRIAGYSCLSDFWMKTLKESYKKKSKR